MPREILFRGFHEDENGSEIIYVDGRTVNGEWIYGYYWLNAIQRAYITTADGDMYFVISATIGQYTGLDDKNGRKIFEGDIVRRKCYDYKLGRREPAGERLLIGNVVWSKNRQEAGSWIVVNNDEFGNLEEYSLLPDVEVTGTIFDKNTLYSEDETELASKDLWTTATAEQQARREPNNDWRISLQAPLSSRTYQRQGENLWVLVEEKYRLCIRRLTNA